MRHLALIAALLILGAPALPAQPTSAEPPSATRTMPVAYPTDKDTAEGILSVSKDGSVILSITADRTHQAIIKEADLSAMRAILENMLIWQETALKNKAEPFEKQIGTHDDRPVIFVYTGPENPALIRQKTTNFHIYANEVPAYLKLLTLYPETRAALDEKIAKSQKESDLFPGPTPAAAPTAFDDPSANYRRPVQVVRRQPATSQSANLGPRSSTRTIPLDYPAPDQAAEGRIWLGEDGQLDLQLINKRTPDTRARLALPEAQAATIQTLLEKMLKWHTIALENKVERFEKPIGELEGQPVTFIYFGPDTPAEIKNDLIRVNTTEAPAYLKLLTLLPETRTTLQQQITKAQKETDLFQ